MTGARKKAMLAKAAKEEEYLSQFNVIKCDMPDEVRRVAGSRDCMPLL